MKRKVFSSFVFAALIGAAMINVTSCADYDSDINALQQQIDNQTTVHNALQTQINGLDAQIKSLQEALNAMKSCQCGDVDKKIADEIAKALAGMNYSTPEDVAKAISDALAGLNTGLTAEEVQKLIDAYHAAHPDCQCGDIQALIEKYLKDNPGLSEADVEAIVKAYHDAHPSSTLTENDVKSIVETYINQLQHFTKEQIEAMINTAITQALAGYVQKSDSYTKSEVEGLIAAAVGKVQPGLSEAEVKALIDAALKNVNTGLTAEEVNKLIADALKNVKPGLTEAEVKALIEAAKCNCPALTTDDVTTIATSVIEKYMKDHPYTLDTAAVENICNSVINNSQVINNLKNSITTLEGTVNQVKEDLQNLKDNVYTKSEVENLINTLIAQAISGLTPNGSLSAEQQAIITNLINTAINNYNAAHPDCNCQYDATAFQALVDAVAANTSAIQGLQPAGDYVTNTQLQQAIQAVKDLIPAAPDLSNYVTVATYNADLVLLNQAISAADTKAQTALDKANANGTAIEGLQTTIQELGDLYISLSVQLDETTHKAEVALNRALSNYFEIETLKSLYSELKSKLEILEAQGYDDTAIKSRLDAVEEHLTTLDNQLATLATKDELAAQLTTVQGLVNDAKAAAQNYADNAAANALTAAKNYTDQQVSNAKDYAKNYADTEIGKVRDDFKAADDALQGQIDTINGKLDTINETLKDLQNQIDELTTKLNALANLITNIELQGSKNPAFGYFSLPVGVTSNVLIAYYGKNEHATFFPSIEDGDLVYADPENWITEEDADRIGMPNPWRWSGGTTFVNDEGNAGKLYLTLNPSNIDFTGTELKLVNSLGEESPVTLGALKKSEDKLTFGQTRATQTYFYEAPATVSAANVGKVNYGISEQLTDALKDVAKNKFGANLSDLSQAVYNQFNGNLDAYAVQATWTDANGEHAVTSNYNIAATAIKPLSYNTLAGVNFKLPTVTPFSERNINLRDYIDLSKFSKEFKKEDLGINIKFDFSDISVDEHGNVVTDVVLIDKNKDYEQASFPIVLISASGVYTDPVTGETKTFTGYNRETAEWVAQIITNRADTWSAQLSKEFTDNIEKLVDKVNEFTAPGGRLESTLDKVLDIVQDKLNSALTTGDKFINQLNNLISQINDEFLGNGNPNLRLQGHVFYEDAKGLLHPMSTAKGMPTEFSGEGEAIELSLSSYSGEILAPAFKKYVAITNVYKDGQDADSSAELMGALKAANAVEGFNQVINGDRYAVAFHPTVKGATYEIVYSALDFHGYISQRKYYVYVK